MLKPNEDRSSFQSPPIGWGPTRTMPAELFLAAQRAGCSLISVDCMETLGGWADAVESLIDAYWATQRHCDEVAEEQALQTLRNHVARVQKLADTLRRIGVVL